MEPKRIFKIEPNYSLCVVRTLLLYLFVVFILCLAKGNASSLGSQLFSLFCSSQTFWKQ